MIGGTRHYNKNGSGLIPRISELAQEFDIDMRLDAGPSAEHMNIHLVRKLTEKYERGGSVVIGHIVKLSLPPPDRTEATVKSLADSGIAATVLPATDLFRVGRPQTHTVCAASPTRMCSTATALNARSPLTMCSTRQRPMVTARSSASPISMPMCNNSIGRPMSSSSMPNPPDQLVAELAQPLHVFENGKRTMAWSLSQLMRC